MRNIFLIFGLLVGYTSFAQKSYPIGPENSWRSPYLGLNARSPWDIETDIKSGYVYVRDNEIAATIMHTEGGGGVVKVNNTGKVLWTSQKGGVGLSKINGKLISFYSSQITSKGKEAKIFAALI